jgi:hypothetical protein
MERRKLPLNFVFYGEVQLRRLVGLAMTQDGPRFARIVVAVVIEENNHTADFTSQSPRRLDFCEQKPLREKPARLLAEANDWCGTHIGSGWVLVLFPKII